MDALKNVTPTFKKKKALDLYVDFTLVSKVLNFQEQESAKGRLAQLALGLRVWGGVAWLV